MMVYIQANIRTLWIATAFDADLAAFKKAMIAKST